MVIICNRRLWITTVFLILQVASNRVVLGSPFRAMYVFGDSIVDDGNNNFINSIAKSNYYPYGCDFAGGPSGRFCNGKTFVDFLGNLLICYIIPKNEYSYLGQLTPSCFIPCFVVRNED